MDTNENHVDGSGWLKVRSPTTGTPGLVPTAYVELLPPSTPRPPSTYSNSSAHTSSSQPPGSSSAAKKKGPAVAPKRGAKRLKYVTALYDYDPRSEAEHEMRAGERFVLVRGDEGDGWADVEKGGVVRSVPANYLEGP